MQWLGVESKVWKSANQQRYCWLIYTSCRVCLNLCISLMCENGNLTNRYERSADFLVLCLSRKLISCSFHRNWATVRLGVGIEGTCRISWCGKVIGPESQLRVKNAKLKQRASGCSVAKKWTTQGERERKTERENAELRGSSLKGERPGRKVELNYRHLQRQGTRLVIIKEESIQGCPQHVASQ